MSKPGLTLANQLITLRDSVRLAASIWRCNAFAGEKLPAVVVTTRYWRGTAVTQGQADLSKQVYYSHAASFCPQGYILVVVDVRGSGASFGHREAECGHEEVLDIGEVIEWTAQQSWCDGRVATNGTSYTANTTLLSLVTAPPALKAAVCRAPDFDAYRHLVAPGGIVNYWFAQAWGHATAAMDRNDTDTLFSSGYWPASDDDLVKVLGVMPVDSDLDNDYAADDSLLAAAITEHRENYNLEASIESLNCIDSDGSASNRPYFDPDYQKAIEQSNVPIVIRCGWHDAGTALGALCMYCSFDAPIRVIIGPCNHDGSFHVDPLHTAENAEASDFDIGKARAQVLRSLNYFFYPQHSKSVGDVDVDVLPSSNPFRTVEYYTLGEGRWKVTEQWPLPQTQMQRWYLADNHQLSLTEPSSNLGSDCYAVDPTTTTGKQNRWYAQSPAQPILFPDRREEDKKLLVYDTPPLTEEMEITGHPCVSLFVRSDAKDGQFFVYLETIDPDGRVRLLTEGQLRGLHRKVSTDTPPYKMFGPYHSLKKADAQPLVPSEVAEITFDLFPISILLSKGQRLRVAIAGADADVFAPIDGCESPALTVERNAIHASYIDLPIIQSKE